MNRVRLGQTERGSYVVTLLSPVPPELEPPKQAAFWPDISDDPYERQVTRRLMQGMEAAGNAVEQTTRGDGFSAFENAVSHGVSANLCEAAANLIEQGAGLDVSVTWAYTRQTPTKRWRRIFLPPEAKVLKEAARLFRDRQPRSDEKLEGYVIKLARPEDQPDGRIALRALVENRQVSIQIDLEKALYEKAVEANKQQLAISITGDLIREGQRWRLRNPHDLLFVQVEDDSPENSVVIEPA
jgi:hypothetical protein